MPFPPRKKGVPLYTARAELARLLKEPMVLRLCPQCKDPKALIEHGVATFVRLCESEDQHIAMEAAKWIVQFGQALEGMRRGTKKEDHELVIAELRALYAKALPKSQTAPAAEQQEPLVVDVESES